MFGEVYKGTHLGKVVAVKTMSEVITGRMKLFRADVRCWQRISHHSLSLPDARALSNVLVLGLSFPVSYLSADFRSDDV
jgi:hypothetical protein